MILVVSGHIREYAFVQSVLQKLIKNAVSANNKPRPTVKTFSIVIDSLSRIGTKDAAEKAEQLLKQSFDLAQSTGDNSLIPDVVTYASVLHAWAQYSGKGGGGFVAAERCEAILNVMHELHKKGYKQVKPNTYAYNTVINAWSKSGVPGAIEKAQALLYRMIEAAKSGHDQSLQPDIVAFNTVLHAWARSGRGIHAAKQAEHLFHKMEELHKLGYPNVEPDAIAYGAMMDCLAKSCSTSNPSGAMKAEKWLYHIEKVEQSNQM